jgi:hypothetical protein
MLIKKYAEKRLRACLGEINNMKTGEFPYPHAKEALEYLHILLSSKLQKLQNFDQTADPSIVSQFCALTLNDLFNNFQLLGFILRSTNVRNAFEVYRPLLRLAGNLIEPNEELKNRKTKLLLSSEWQYSPYIYNETLSLPDFILIGLPASESSNPLLIPMAGHELGHRVWAKADLHQQSLPDASQSCLNLILAQWTDFVNIFQLTAITKQQFPTSLMTLGIVDRAAQFTLKQAEESFCDFIGLRIFGIAYLHAFAYQVAPNPAGQRHVFYPNTKDRAANLVEAAKRFSIAVPNNYIDLFENLPEPSRVSPDSFLLKIADGSLQTMLVSLIDKADSIVKTSGTVLPTDSEVQRIFNRLKMVVPAENAQSLADILCAGWLAWDDSNFWAEMPRIHSSKDKVLYELLLKNIEVFDIEQIQKDATNAGRGNQ